MEGISRRNFMGWTAWTALGLGATRGLGAQEPVAANTAQAPDGAAGESSPALRAIDAFVQRHIREQGIPGLTLGLADRQGVIAARSYGQYDVKTGAALRPQDLFEIGSITKSITAAIIHQLAAEGRLSLDGDARPLLPETPWPMRESRSSNCSTMCRACPTMVRRTRRSGGCGSATNPASTGGIRTLVMCFSAELPSAPAARRCDN